MTGLSKVGPGTVGVFLQLPSSLSSLRAAEVFGVGKRSEGYACTGILPCCAHWEYGRCLGKANLQCSLCCLLLPLTSLLPFFILQVALKSHFSGVDSYCPPYLPPTQLGAPPSCPLSQHPMLIPISSISEAPLGCKRWGLKHNTRCIH